MAGDIQNLPNEPKAQRIGAACISTAPSSKWDYYPLLTQLYNELFRRGASSPELLFTPLFLNAWQSLPALNTVCNACGDGELAKRVVMAAMMCSVVILAMIVSTVMTAMISSRDLTEMIT